MGPRNVFITWSVLIIIIEPATLPAAAPSAVVNFGSKVFKTASFVQIQADKLAVAIKITRSITPVIPTNNSDSAVLMMRYRALFRILSLVSWISKKTDDSNFGKTSLAAGT